ncbi:hypothetical protein M758_7G046900 [Ceratodon purpureus]|nr:hypothetical protein M758_7G046900 [Ceratodon purpureus]
MHLQNKKTTKYPHCSLQPPLPLSTTRFLLLLLLLSSSLSLLPPPPFTSTPIRTIDTNSNQELIQFTFLPNAPVLFLITTDHPPLRHDKPRVVNTEIDALCQFTFQIPAPITTPPQQPRSTREVEFKRQAELILGRNSCAGRRR